MMRPPVNFVILIELLASVISAQSNTTRLSKRGLLYIGTDHQSDTSIFTSSRSPLTWFYTFGPEPAYLPGPKSLEFVPMIHGADNAQSDVDAIRSLSNIESVLVFNEPDGSVSSGGSNVSPSEAARTFINTISPLRDQHGLKLSLPATTGSSRGLQWLNDFNASCHRLRPRRGCEFDFIAAHWYGDFGSMASWLGTLHSLYPNKPVWLTEFALPSAPADATLVMMNESLPFLDATEWIERYAWFGSFRADDANEWTGDGVAMLNNQGSLTQLGAEYLGGNITGFREGEHGNGNGASQSRTVRLDWVMMAAVCIACHLVL